MGMEVNIFLFHGIEIRACSCFRGVFMGLKLKLDAVSLLHAQGLPIGCFLFPW